MLAAYLNYPEHNVTLHCDLSCPEIQKRGKERQRKCQVNRATASREMERFASGEHRFGSTSDVNDMWVEVDFDDPEFEKAVVRHICRLLGKRYSWFQQAEPAIHC